MQECNVISVARLTLKPASPLPVQPLFPEQGEQSVLIFYVLSRHSPSHPLTGQCCGTQHSLALHRELSLEHNSVNALVHSQLID